MALGLPKNQREQAMVLVVIVAMGLVGLYYRMVYSPKNVTLASIQQHVDQVTKSNQAAKAEVAKGTVDELRAQAARYQDNLDLMRQLVPTGNEVPALIEQVSTAARHVGLDIGALEPQPVVAGDAFDTYRYKLIVIGPYHNLGEFLTNVGSLPRIVAPVTMKLTPSQDKAKHPATKTESALQSEFVIQTYVARGGVSSVDEPRGMHGGAK